MRRLTALSGFDTKGPACFLLEIQSRRLLLDLGEGPDAGRRPDLSHVGPVDAVLISHAHADHVGALDLLPRLGSPPIFCTQLARATGPASLAASSELPVAGNIVGLRIETGPAGHAPGAVWMRIGGEEGLLYTGDISGPGGLYAWGPPLPARALVFDASYGVAAEKIATQRRRLLALAASGPLLLPAPPSGRGLEMALTCLEAALPVTLCPEHVETARLVLKRPSSLAPGMATALEKLSAEAALLHPDSPACGVMVAAGANAGSGLSAMLAARFIGERSATVLFTGHLSLGAPSVDWVAQSRAQWMRWNVHPDAAGLDALLDAVRPAMAMPAFVAAAGRDAIASRYPATRFAKRPVMEW